jgi:hypothetical protein
LNAVDALAAGGDIHLGAHRDDGCVGSWCPTPASGCHRTSGRGSSSRSSRPRASAGPASGWPRCFAIVQQHGARWRSGRRPGGARRSSCACRPPRPPATKAGRTTPPTVESSTLRILAVDDDPAHGRMLAAMLGHDGHQVTVVGLPTRRWTGWRRPSSTWWSRTCRTGRGPMGGTLPDCVRRDGPAWALSVLVTAVGAGPRPGRGRGTGRGRPSWPSPYGLGRPAQEVIGAR